MKTRYVWIPLLALPVFLGVIFLLRLPLEAAVRLEPVTASQPDFGHDPIIVVADERVFTLFAALNAAGFDREYEGIAMSHLRQRVRTALSGKDISSLERLKPIFEQVPDYHLVVWVLQRGNPPELGRAESGWWVSTSAADFDGLDEALRVFYIEADIRTLWKEMEPAYQAEIKNYDWQLLAEESLENIQTYLKTSKQPFRQAVIIPNALDSYYSGNGPQVGEITYVVAGPTETELNRRGLIEHELLHSFIGPILDQNIGQISSKTSRRLYAVLKRTMPSGYGTWASVLEETLNRAINLRMLGDAGLRNQQLDQLEAAGFLLIKPLDQALADYEQSGMSFEEYLPTLLESLDTVELPNE